VIIVREHTLCGSLRTYECGQWIVTIDRENQLALDLLHCRAGVQVTSINKVYAVLDNNTDYEYLSSGKVGT
jgi:hypothetical protein